MDDLVATAAALLGGGVRLAIVERLRSPNELVRCRVEAGTGQPGTVLVKRAPDQRLDNEVAALQALAARPGPWPRLVAAGEGIAIVEDLGDLPTVLDLLRGNDAATAARCFPAMGEALAALHASGAEPPPSPPRSDSTFDARSDELRRELEDCWATLGLAPPVGFWEEVGDLQELIHGPGPFRTFLHADAGPQNFLWGAAACRLVDFEFATYGHALLDVVSARLGFPHSAQAQTVPMRHVEALEAAYWSASDPPGDIERAITDACAHWTLIRWGGLWRRFAEPVADQAGMRAQAFTVYRRFVATAEASGHRTRIAQATDAYAAALQRRFPGLDETPPYPALG